MFNVKDFDMSNEKIMNSAKSALVSFNGIDAELSVVVLKDIFCALYDAFKTTNMQNMHSYNKFKASHGFEFGLRISNTISEQYMVLEIWKDGELKSNEKQRLLTKEEYEELLGYLSKGFSLIK